MKPDDPKFELRLRKWQKVASIFGLFIVLYVFVLPWVIVFAIHSPALEDIFWNRPQWFVMLISAIVYPLFFIYENLGLYEKYIEFIFDFFGP